MHTQEARVTPSSSGEVASIVPVAAILGFAAGLFEAAYRVGWHETFRHGAVDKSLFVLWMAPVAELACCALVGVVLAVLVRVAPRRLSPRAATYAVVFVAWLGVMLAIPPLASYARVILAAGFTQVTMKGWDRQRVRTGTLAWCTLVLLLAAAAGAAGLRVWERVHEQRAVAALPPPPRDAPNVLLITLDTVRARNLSLYGYTRSTSPALERLAARGVVFDRAFAAASWTLPSHATIFSGRYPRQLDASWFDPVHLPDRSLAPVLAAHGYETAGFAANLIYCVRERGLARGMVHYEDRRWSPGTVLISGTLGRAIADSATLRRTIGYHEVPGRKSAARLNDDFLRWEAARRHDRPFFAFLNYFDAHEPLLPPAPYDRRYGPIDASGAVDYKGGADIGFAAKNRWSAADAAKYRNAYDGAITCLDHEVGELFAELERRRLLEQTLVIITADHGEALGERGLYGHGNSLYVDTIHVPLFISLPGRVPAGIRVDRPVGLRDLPATIADLAGVGGAGTFPGASLAASWSGTPAAGRAADARPVLSELAGAPFFEPQYPTAHGDLTSLVEGRLQYIRNGDGREELYDFVADPDEARDLSNTEAGRAALPALRTALEALTTRGARKPANSRAQGRTSRPDTSTR